MKRDNERLRDLLALAFAFFAHSIYGSASEQHSPRLSMRPPITFQNPVRPCSTTFRNLRRGSRLKSSTAEDTETPDVNEKRLIQVVSELELPFSREVAYDAYSDLTRQPSWSSWLHSVEYTDESQGRTKWTLKFMGIKYSWTAMAVKKERPHIIQWQSTSGLQNYGTVKFLPTNDPQKPTRMTLQMTFVVPLAAAAVFRTSRSASNFVQAKMIMESMTNFRDIVLENDLKEKGPTDLSTTSPDQ